MRALKRAITVAGAIAAITSPDVIIRLRFYLLGESTQKANVGLVRRNKEVAHATPRDSYTPALYTRVAASVKISFVVVAFTQRRNRIRNKDKTRKRSWRETVAETRRPLRYLP